MILVIDNGDSFVYNIVQLLGEIGVGNEIVLCRNDCIELNKLNEKPPSHIILSPGHGKPEKNEIVLQLISSLAHQTSILGIGLGHQAIASTFGGRIVSVSRSVIGKTAEICHDSQTIYKGLEYRFQATCYYSSVVDRDHIPIDLEVSATSPDGIIMGLRHRKFRCEGVQFHPESILTTSGKSLFKNFIFDKEIRN